MLVRSTFNKNVYIIILKLARVSLNKVTVGCKVVVGSSSK